MAPLVWLVTGTTSGIGAALVQHIAARGDKVIATGRKAEQRLGHLKSDSVAILDLDISAGYSQVESQIQKAWGIFGNIDVLMNNAGASAMKSAEEADEAYVNDLFQVNLFGHMNITRAILPRFRAQGHGRIGFTSSSSAWGPLPYMSHYAAAKAALSAYVESLHKEVNPLGIQCVDFMCGGFATNLGQPRETGQAAFGAEGTQIAAYSPLLGDLVGMFALDPMSFMPGDLTKVATVMVDIIKSEGIAAGRPWTLSVALGSDSFDSGKQRSHDHLQLLNEWKDVSYSTDRDDHSHVTSKKYLGFASSILEHRM
ncbi:hypothetical protein B0T10DRAFT_601081 [Thelonectria olida]|uniref:Uncharacterized protein n=1 Tax=Thelonectria olida TaxID=1576542 RepID=A0A9P8WEP1_9HYPO|nr:hypothetical protein B0T10DRAFT_601081 [Thelonectria olida]